MSHYIPPELIPNILARLPIQDVLRCTSVCKSWYNLITSSSFISSHVKLSPPNQESRLLISFYSKTERKKCYNVHTDNAGLDQIGQLWCPAKFRTAKFRTIGSINGLICLVDDVSYETNTIVFWNPSLGKSLILPKPRAVAAFDSETYYDQCFGFGFLPETNDYKIVRLAYSQPLPNDEDDHVPDHSYQAPEVEIYELSTGSWRGIVTEDLLYLILTRSKHVFLNGIVHWIGSKPDNICVGLIVSFDMTSENFGTLMIPNCLIGTRGIWIWGVYAFNESLSVISSVYSVDVYNIWVMNEYGVADSWEKKFNVDVGHSLSFTDYFCMNGDIVFLSKYRDSFSDKPSLISYYFIKNEFMKNVEKSSLHVDNYIESLVLIGGPKKMRKRVRNDKCKTKLGEDEFTKHTRLMNEIFGKKIDMQTGQGSESKELQKRVDEVQVDFEFKLILPD